MEPGLTCDGRENPRGFSTDRRKFKSHRPQFVVVISEECPYFLTMTKMAALGTRADVARN